MSVTAFNIGFGAYALAALLGCLCYFVKKGRLQAAFHLVFALGLAAVTFSIAARWAEAGRPPFSNMYESAVVFVWTIGVAYLALEAKFKTRVMGGGVALLSVLALSGACLTLDQTIHPLVPALKSNWLTFHVLSCFVGYGGFAVAFGGGVTFLIAQLQKKGADGVDAVIGHAMKFGFLFLTIGIITGAVWANEAWGTYWSWDPKETWSLITWIVYAVFIHFPLVAGWLGLKSKATPRTNAVFSIIGFAAVLFTYVGVNYLLAGLHSYA